ncbi:bile acid:sodium symporter family protein [Agromyces fucosus]|uniref:Bile acid:sodium symporter family protein n=1 Tax=Agromyces fucosus TaxID=41985 RepID=A0A4Q2JWL4_9MICO|nr:MULTISPECIES: bile acid:sodium symporter family protein [Agromyces]KQZ08890.1 symporter [Agromyces sp. Root1464]RXZ51199.1 bile acid:sodium symporter family protein [Agromyces fucosus]
MNIDDVVLNFTPGSLIALNIVLGLIMFGIALDTAPSDFKAVAKAPKAMIIALAAQIILLPAVTFGLTLLLNVQASIALGMILVACCPPGNISQVLTYRSGGNVALSVSMTAVSNVIYIFLLPISLAFWGGLHPTASKLVHEVSLDGWQMLFEIFLIIGVPFFAGLLIRAKLPRFAAKVQPYARWVSLIGLVGFIAAALIGNWAIFMAFIGVVLLAVFLHDAVALGLGYASARIGGLGVRDRKAITFEVGIRNAGLGLGLVFAFFGGLGGMAVVAGWWGIWDIVAGLTVATLWARHSKRADRRSTAGRSRSERSERIEATDHEPTGRGVAE